MPQVSQPPAFLVHDPIDSVGVIVIEGAAAGDSLTGWVMDTEDAIDITITDPIPLGHKVALCAINEGDTITRYGSDIGRSMADIGIGSHVHIHNMKTKKW